MSDTKTKTLKYAISNSNIDLINELFTVENATNIHILNIIHRPKLYPTLELLLENNEALRNYVSKKITSYQIQSYIYRHSNIKLLNLCMTYLSSGGILQEIFNQAIYKANLVILNMLFEIGYDMDLAFDQTTIFEGYCEINDVYDSKITFDTFLYLDNIGIDILSHINKVYLNFCYANDICGLEFCLKNGVDPNDVFATIENPVNINVTKCLVVHGTDMTKLNFDAIKNFMASGNNSASIIYLIENGLDVRDYLYPLLNFCIGRSIDIIIYFVNLGMDINMMNKLLLESCCLDNIECVKFLLDSGADIHCKNNSILDFTYKYGMNYVQDNCFSISKLLISRGATSNNLTYTFCLSIIKLLVCKVDVELFTYFLDLGINLNSKFDIDAKKMFKINDAVEYILDAIVYFGQSELFKLCLKYGTNPYINNHSPLTIAVKMNQLEIIKILLYLGSVVDLNIEYIVKKSTINLLNEYQIEHKLRAKK